MIEGPITFDRAIRWVIIIALVASAFLILDYLSAVLLPFFIAWILAYLLYPLVNFIERRMKVKMRVVSIMIAFFSVVVVLGGVFYLIIPPMLDEFSRFTTLATRYLHNATHIKNFPETIQWWLSNNSDNIEKFLKSDNFTTTVKDALPTVFSAVSQGFAIVLSIIASGITLLYMFFILFDYEYLTENWIRIFPKKLRPFWQDLAKDVKISLNNYIRGQGLIALTMGILFCIGFLIIDFPMAIGLGILIGIMDMVPYLHSLALIPTAFLAAMKAAETGQSYWIVFGSALLVFAIVQALIDMIVTPKIMGHQMGLNPAVLLLSLSIWGALLGFIGLIIALPATTVIILYWKRYITKEEEDS
jgi:predicted PurR-regulated permease PerM